MSAAAQPQGAHCSPLGGSERSERGGRKIRAAAQPKIAQLHAASGGSAAPELANVAASVGVH